MREKELLKIVQQGDFDVIKISKTDEGLYILKQMSAIQSQDGVLLKNRLNFLLLILLFL